MATKKSGGTPTKKAAKKTASRSAKSAAPKAATLNLMGQIPKMQLSMPLDAKKIAAIQKCIAKGTLTVSLSKVDLGSGKLGGPWLYD